MLRNFLILCFAFMAGPAHAALHWSPIQVVPSSADASSMKLAVNNKSTGLLTWFQKSDQTIQTSYYLFVDKKWTTPQSIPASSDAITLLTLYFNDSGKGALLWFDHKENSLYLARLSAEGSWSSPFVLHLTSPAEEIQSIFDNQGNLSIAWTSWNGLEKIIQGVFYSESLQTWSSISDISPISMNCRHPRIAMNAQGRGVVVWQASLAKGTHSNTQSFIQAVTFNHPQFQWSKPFYFGYDWLDTCLTNPDVAIDSSNNIAIIWEKMRTDQPEKRLQYVRFLEKKNQWSYVSEIEMLNENPHLGKDPQHVQVMWTAHEGSNKGLNIAKFDIENNLWISAHNLTKTENGISNVKVTTDSLGKLNLAWLLGRTIQVIHYDKGWMPPVHLDKNLQCEMFEVGNDKIGNTLLTLIHGGNLMFCTGNYLLPPDFFDGRKVEVRYPSRKVMHGYLSWCHAESPNVVGYILRRNGVVLAILPVHNLQYTDYRCPFGPVSYELTIVNVDNIESHPVKRDL